VDIEARHNQAQLVKSLDNDLTLFHPPKKHLGKNFYPDDIAEIKEYREYIHAFNNKPDHVTRAYNNRTHLRPADMLDPVFRGSDVFAQRSVFVPNPDAAQPIHSQLGWKSVLSTNDNLAVANPRLAAKFADFKKQFQKQGEWVQKQDADMKNRTERFAHLAVIIREEIAREHERETRMLAIPFGDKKVLNHTSKAIWKERIEAADRIMKTMKAYEVGVSGTCEADYLIFCLDEWLRESTNGKKVCLHYDHCLNS
jgi:hypothetical protein